MAKNRRSWSKKIIDAYCKAYPAELDSFRDNLAHLIIYSKNRQERNADFIEIWQLIQEKTHAYLEALAVADLGSKEYKNVIAVYMSFLGYTRSVEEDTLLLQLIAALETVAEKQGSGWPDV